MRWRTGRVGPQGRQPASPHFLHDIQFPRGLHAIEQGHGPTGQFCRATSLDALASTHTVRFCAYRILAPAARMPNGPVLRPVHNYVPSSPGTRPLTIDNILTLSRLWNPHLLHGTPVHNSEHVLVQLPHRPPHYNGSPPTAYPPFFRCHLRPRTTAFSPCNNYQPSRTMRTPCSPS